MDLGKLSRGERIIVIAGVLLVIDLLFLPWHSINVPYIGSVDRNAISSPNAFLGFLAALAAAAWSPRSSCRSSRPPRCLSCRSPGHVPT